MTDKSTEARGGEALRPFASYTPADHARVAMAADALFLAAACHQAIIPEGAAAEGSPPTAAIIGLAGGIVRSAAKLMESAVVTAYEAGATWEQIGRALGDGITRQSAHARYAPAVAEFREQLAAALGRARPGKDPLAGETRICDTAWYAPFLDEAATVEQPGMLGPPPATGEFLKHLSDPETAAPAQLAGVRGPDALPPHCRYTQGLDDPYLDGMYSWLTCTLREGHPGRHQLAVTCEG